MESKDEEILQRFQRGVKQIMRFFNQELKKQSMTTYHIYDAIFNRSAAMFPMETREALELGIANENLTTKQKQELLDTSSKGEENNSVFTFFHHNMAKHIAGREVNSKGEMREKFKKFHGTSGNYSENIKGWWLVKPTFYDKGQPLYLLHIFPYSAYDFPERLKDTDLWSDYDGLSFYYATIYSNHRNSVSFSKEKGDKPFPWTSGKGWEGNTDFVYLGRTVKEITQPETQGILNWWGFLAD